MIRETATSVGEDFPKEQQRVRECVACYQRLDGTPGVNVKFAIAALEQVLRRADQAMASGDSRDSSELPRTERVRVMAS